jgi:hypothetical protein
MTDLFHLLWTYALHAQCSVAHGMVFCVRKGPFAVLHQNQVLLCIAGFLWISCAVVAVMACF